MKKIRFMISFAAVIWFALMLPMTASANSSWHWISSKRPYELLLFIVPLTPAASADILFVVGNGNLAHHLCRNPHIRSSRDKIILIFHKTL